MLKFLLINVHLVLGRAFGYTHPPNLTFMRMVHLLISLLTVFACEDSQPHNVPDVLPPVVIDTVSWVIPAGTTIATRFRVPLGFGRTAYAADAFGHYLQQQPLQGDGSEVRLFNGELKGNQTAHAAVLDVDSGRRNCGLSARLRRSRTSLAPDVAADGVAAQSGVPRCAAP